MAASYFDLAADLGSEEEDGDYDEETGEPSKERLPKQRTTDNADSSDEEEEDDDDEEEQRKIAEGFIADEDEEEDGRERKRKKRTREDRPNDDDVLLDEDDLDLIGFGQTDRSEEQSKFKRLKRGHREDHDRIEARGVEEIFEDEDEGNDDRRAGIGRGLADEFEDFIEDDDLSDEEAVARRDAAEVARPTRRGYVDPLKLSSGLDEAAQEDMLEAFGDGTEYDWALALQDEADAIQDDADRVLELKDVFEPSQLVDKMLTDEDILIRSIDIPERYQLARKPFKELALSADDMRAYIAKEAEWMCALMGPKKQLSGEIKTIFEKIVKTILHFMIVDNFDIPFIFSTRKDYLIYDERVPLSPHADDDKEDDIKFTTRPIRLLQYTDLWEMSELDLKYRALMEKRESLVTMFTALQGHGVEDELFLEMTEKAQTMEELQDIYDYVHFQYSTQLKDAQAVDSGYEDVNGGHGTTQKRVRSSKNVWDRIRNGRPYNLVKVLGTPADKVAQNILGAGQRAFIEDANERPDDLADSLVDAEDFPTGIQVLNAAKMMYAEELVMSPRMRKFARQLYYSDGVFDCIRTEKGLRQLDRDHPAYEFKYLKAQGLGRLVREPDVFLRMLKAEEDGLIEVTLRLQDPDLLQKILAQHIVTDNVSDIADSWNTIRKETINLALQRLCKIIIKGCKDSLRTEFETKLAEKCRAEYFSRLDQAPYKPKGHTFGVIPKILAISNGAGNRGDATCWAYVDDYGKALETGKFTDLRAGDPDKLIPEGKDVSFLVDLLERRPSDVIVISGWSIEAQKLYIRIEEIVKQKNLFVIIEKKDPETGETENITGLLPVELIDDEVARLYHTSERGVAEYPNLPPLTRYCIALARYAQSPVMEYAGLSRDIISISFDQHQSLIPREKLLKYLDMAMIEVVNSVGIEINEAAVDTRVANMLQYISGLGPRKATQMLQTINRNGNIVINRTHLLGDVDRAIRPACGPKIWENCASFVYIEWDETEQEADYLDYTRIHPEDYVLARKITADTLDLDEEDIRAEQDENGESAVIRRLLKDNAQDQLDELELGDYAAAIFEKQGLKKKATLELIRDELQNPFEELRNNFIFRSTSEIFTMLTGETEDTLRSGMLVTISIRRIYSDHLEVRLDSGIEGIVDALSMPLGVGPDSANDPRSVFQQYQTLRAKITKLDREKFKAFLTLREEEMTNPYRKEVDQPEEGQWDAEQESNDKLQVEKSQTDIKGRVQRVIKHPLYRPFNSAQAQEFLGTQSRGEVLIRPSGKGTDHLTVTWKVAENCFQHIDVLELDKENEFSVGRTLRVGGKSYSDLDELIELHVRAMAKKVDEIMGDERFQDGNKAATEQWLSTYTLANPKRSMYAFCLNREYPGYFHLCFKAGSSAPVCDWPVKVIPNAFELQKNAYPDMRALKNGFKVLIARKMAGGRL